MTRVSRRTLVALAALHVVLFAVALASTRVRRTEWFDEKLAAARIAEAGLSALRAEALRNAVAIDPVNDPNGTGVVGPEFTPITTDRGLLDAKLTATNPNFAAAVVGMLKAAGLRAGDAVGVSLTGSMPGANLSVLAACEALGLRPIVVTSIGASSFGATEPDWTWLDMEAVLAARGVLRTRSVAASLGGGKDRGRGLSEEGRGMLRAAATRHGVPLIEEETLEVAIRRRAAVYDSAAAPGRLAAFVNVGGGLASLGAAVNGTLVPPGLSVRLARKNYPTKGVTILMGERGLPVIHILEVEMLARQAGLPIAPSPLPGAGEGEAFVEVRYDPVVAALVLLLLVAALVLAIRADLAQKWGRRRGVPADALALLLGLSAAVSALLPPAAARAAAPAPTPPAPGAAAPTAAAPWLEIRPPAAETVPATIGGKPFVYRRLDDERAVEITVGGPARLRIATRYAYPPRRRRSPPPAEASYAILVSRDGGEAVAHARSTVPGSNAVWGSRTLGENREIHLAVPEGRHTYRILLPPDAPRRVLARFARRSAPPGAAAPPAGRQAPMSPAEFAAAVVLITGERESTHFRATPARPAVLEVFGPTRLSVSARLEFDERMLGTQDYRLEVREDGAVKHTYQMSAERSDVTRYRSEAGRVPGVGRTVTVEVPPGLHAYEVRPRGTIARGVLLKFSIPARDVGRGE